MDFGSGCQVAYKNAFFVVRDVIVEKCITKQVILVAGVIAIGINVVRKKN
jgi:hypothetical protein